MFVHLRYNGLDLIVGGVYIPPASAINIHDDLYFDLESIFEWFSDSSYVIASDFKLPNFVKGGNEVLQLSVSQRLHNVIRSTCSFFYLIFSNINNIEVSLLRSQSVVKLIGD